jgi:spore germination protein YaaH
MLRFSQVMRFLFPFGVFFIFVLSTSPAYAATRTLVQGLTGSDVTNLQNELIANGYLSAGSATGHFGPLTLTAVQKFQCDQDIVCAGGSYGVAGPLTQTALANVDPATGGNIAPVSSAELTGKSAGPAWTGKLEVGGWIPYWSTASGTADVLPHLSQLTEVSPFVIVLQNDGTLYDAGGITQEPWTSFIAAAKAQNVRVIPTVMWGNGAAEQTILSNPATRVALENSIATMAQQDNFDGVDIDFEAKQADTENYFSTFLKGLYGRMGNKWVYCSIETRMPLSDRYSPGVTPPLDATEYANDYTQINKYCDRVEIMAYDQGSIDLPLDAARAAPYEPVADPAWVSDVVNLAAQTISKSKIIIGIPTYGYEYSVTPEGSGYQYDLQWALDPRYALNLAAELGIHPVRNSADELSFIYKTSDALVNGANTVTPISTSTDNNVAPPSAVYSQQSIAGSIQPPFNIVWWSDSQAISDKIVLAKQLGVRGVAIFKFDGGEDPNIWSVLPSDPAK